MNKTANDLRLCKKCGLQKHKLEFHLHRSTGGKRFKRCLECRQRSQAPGFPLEPRYWIRHHAVERYQQRVAPHLTFNQARRQMILDMEQAPLLIKSPKWLAAGKAWGQRGRVEGYLLVKPGVVFLVGRYPGDARHGVLPRVKTVLVRESALRTAKRYLAYYRRRALATLRF